MSLDREVLDQTIRRLFSETFELQNDGAAAPALAADSVLLATGLDSLGFAILVARLEEELGFDPFSLAAEPYYPKTYHDFLTFYWSNQP